MSPRGTRSFCRMRSHGARCWEPATFIAARTFRTTRVIRTVDTSYIRGMKRMANLATRSPSKAVRRCASHAVMALNKRQIIELGTSLGVDYSLTTRCTTLTRRRRVRPLRRLQMRRKGSPKPASLTRALRGNRRTPDATRHDVPRSRRSSTRCRRRAQTGRPAVFAASWLATCGRTRSTTAQPPNASSAIRTSWEATTTAEAMPPRRRSPARCAAVCIRGSRRDGNAIRRRTGGEPLLQLDAAAIAALHDTGFEVAVESNGTRAAPVGIDWLCVSPKVNDAARAHAGCDELKLGTHSNGALPERFEHLDFPSLFPAADVTAPISSGIRAKRWSIVGASPLALSLQTHKVWAFVRQFCKCRM